MSEYVCEFSSAVEPKLPALSLYRGLTDNQIDQLIAYTREDELVRTFDSDDERFGSRKLYDEWITSKDRTMYALTDANGKLYGVYWIGPKEIPQDRNYTERINPADYPFTMATRLYGAARGHHLSTRFVLTATDDYVRQKRLSSAGFWAEVSAENERSLHKNRAAGYRIVTTSYEKNGKVIMVQDYKASH